MPKRLLDRETNLGITSETWAHDGKITVVTTSDASKAFKKAKQLSQSRPDKDFMFSASIDANVVNDISYTAAKNWGVSAREAFAELMAAKTDRSKKLWRILTKGRDYRKFQRANYQ